MSQAQQLSEAPESEILPDIIHIDYPFCIDVSSKYEKLIKIGHGTYGEVFKARNRETNQFVAVKKILCQNETNGFPLTSIREINILKNLKHENIVNLIEVCQSKRENKLRFHLVFEFCEHDLAGLLRNSRVEFSFPAIKMAVKQLFEAIYYIHSNRIIHRDIKSSNILITKNGVLKLADFGLSRPYSTKQNKMTEKVVTLWYRPPEILLGERIYGPPVDIWSAGCVMAEIWLRLPLLKESTEQSLLLAISQLCGSINPQIWPAVEKLPLFNKLELPKNCTRKVKERLKVYVSDLHTLNLLDNILVLDPSKRLNADSVLNHDFFWTDPMPGNLENVLLKCNQSMFDFTSQQTLQRQQQSKVKTVLFKGPY